MDKRICFFCGMGIDLGDEVNYNDGSCAHRICHEDSQEAELCHALEFPDEAEED